MGQRPGGPENSPQMAHLDFLLGGIHRVAHTLHAPKCTDEGAYRCSDMIKRRGKRSQDCNNSAWPRAEIKPKQSVQARENGNHGENPLFGSSMGAAMVKGISFE